MEMVAAFRCRLGCYCRERYRTGHDRACSSGNRRHTRQTVSSRYVGRFAPSPTGPLHFGSLVAALASYVDARAHEGQWLIRIEDVDTQRCSREDEAMILRQLRDYGFEHDGNIVRQSERAARYREALDVLDKKRLSYRCVCTRKMLATTRRNSEGEIVYPGMCRNANIAHDALRPTAIRLNVAHASDAMRVEFQDRSYDRVFQDVAHDVGDFVLLRADGDFAYQLAVVVDDAAQGVTHIVRGADLLLNTPRQILLQRALELPTPQYLHVPIATNASGEKLSKQTLAPTLPTELNARIDTLASAWAFLRQAPIAKTSDPHEFLRNAVAAWQPARLASLKSSDVATNL
jgi:glutamyl-Q tRNA(Asp) synthetase